MPHRVRVRRRPVLAAIVAAAALAPAGTAQAAFTSTVTTSGGVTMEGSSLPEHLTVSVAVGLLIHDQTGPGFASSRDWDTDEPGEQTVAADGKHGIEVFGLGGDDVLDMRPAGAAVDGDSLHGGDGDDRLYSTPDGEFVTGGDGTDLIVAGGGDDTIRAGAGDDLILWSDGDGSDDINGDAGIDDLMAVGASGGEGFVITAGTGDPTAVKLARTAPSATALAIVGTERIQLDAGGGADTVTAGAGLAARTRLVLDGGPGPDAITGGDGPDLLDAGPGDDVVAALDGIGDVVWCGPGADAATLDPGGLDQHSGCEEVNGVKIRLIRPGPVQLPAARARLRMNLVVIPVSCPATAAAGCRDTIAIETAAGLRLGSARFALRAGARRTVGVRVPAATRLLAAGGARTLRARALVQTADGAVRARRIAIEIPRRG
jgi:Ca2+-binding RTX toxin-like protein